MYFVSIEVIKVKFSIVEIKRRIGEKMSLVWEEPIDSFGDLTAWGLRLQQPVAVSLVVTNLGNRIAVGGHAHCEFEAECSRCLERFPTSLEVEISEQFLLAGRPTSDEADSDGEEEEDLPVLDGDGIDGTELVTAAVISQLPMQPLCSPGCKGLCPDCGENLNIAPCRCTGNKVDPRLAALEEWFKKNPDRDSGDLNSGDLNSGDQDHNPNNRKKP